MTARKTEREMWTELDCSRSGSVGLMTLLSFVEMGGGVNRPLTYDETRKYRDILESAKTSYGMDAFSYYGNGHITDCSEATLLKDGKVLMCITTKSFNGTFASHDDIQVRWIMFEKQAVVGA